MINRKFPYKDQEKEIEFQKFKADYDNGKIELVDMYNDEALTAAIKKIIRDEVNK